MKRTPIFWFFVLISLGCLVWAALDWHGTFLNVFTVALTVVNLERLVLRGAKPQEPDDEGDDGGFDLSNV